VGSGEFRCIPVRWVLDSGGFWWILPGSRGYWPVLVMSGTAPLEVTSRNSREMQNGPE